MSDMFKINKNVKRNFEIGESDIYRKFSEQFDNLFNAEEVARMRRNLKKSMLRMKTLKIR